MKNQKNWTRVLRLQNVETIDKTNSITGSYDLIGNVENTDFIVVECNDTKELFVIHNSNLNVY